MPPQSPGLVEAHEDRIVRVEDKVEEIKAHQATQTVQLSGIQKTVDELADAIHEELIPSMSKNALAVDDRLRKLEDTHMATKRDKERLAGWIKVGGAAVVGALGTAFGQDIAAWVHKVLA